MHDLDETRRDETLRDPLPLEEVERLVGLVRESGVGEVRVRQGDVEISVKAAAEPQAPPRAETRPDLEAESSAEPDSPEMDGLHAIRSPLVGTFYRAPAPGDEPYVEVGDRVRAGEILCIVEAMKLMNEIESDVDGTVVKVFPQNAQPVEFGEPLFAIETS